MFARSSTFSGDPACLEDGIAYVNDEVMPMIASIDGCVGLSMMVDRETGECIATSSWATEEDMRFSGDRMAPMRERLGEILGCRSEARVEEWEVAAMHRDHATGPGCWCRVTWIRTDHADVDRGIEIYKSGVLPRMEQLDGFCSASLMVNRSLSRACATTSFDSRDALGASQEEAWAIRDAGVREAGVDVIDVGEYELVVAHLRVPEMA